jgi:3-phenylpropionate/cinnamic acid dioxygenase small subunit
VTEADVGRLVEIEAIKQLKARYFRFLDARQWDDWAMVFTEDAVLELPEAESVTTGRSEVVANVSAGVEGARTVHQGFMPEIELTGPDTATGVWATCDYVEWSANEDGSRVGIKGYGHYHEQYRREGGEWRIARTRLVRLRVDPIS